jgi:hypothetical protein
MLLAVIAVVAIPHIKELQEQSLVRTHELPTWLHAAFQVTRAAVTNVLSGLIS